MLVKDEQIASDDDREKHGGETAKAKAKPSIKAFGDEIKAQNPKERERTVQGDDTGYFMNPFDMRSIGIRVAL